MRRFRAVLLTLLVGGVPLAPTAADDGGSNFRFGMPSPATAEAGHREDFLIERPQYALSYNARTRAPNWVSWRLRKDDVGNAARAPFEQDPKLPKGFTRITSHAYDGCGFDRGHMCPAKDRSASPHDIRATFYMTNVLPQSPACNQKAWERLEAYCRDLVKKGHELHIVCGPHGVGGTGKNGHRAEIGRGRMEVTVPARLWKVIVVLPYEGAEPRKNTRVIAVLMPNDQTVDYDWMKYRVAVKEIQRLTGYQFFRNMPPSIAAALRSHVDDVMVHAPRRR
jgi:endonuclease G, mitochondrial